MHLVGGSPGHQAPARQLGARELRQDVDQAEVLGPALEARDELAQGRREEDHLARLEAREVQGGRERVQARRWVQEAPRHLARALVQSLL